MRDERAERATSRASAPARAGFVGRARELAQLESALDEAASGRGAVRAIVGEPGIGKSHLAQELATRARERGFRVAWGSCVGSDAAPAFWPWTQLLREALEDDERASLVEGAEGLLAQLVPELAARAAREALPDDETRFELFDAVVSFWRRAARRAPRLLVIDDLHWADAGSLALLELAALSLRGAAVAIVVTFRETEASLDRARSERIEAVLALGPRVRLTGFDRSEVARLVEAIAGSEPSEPLLDAIQDLTAGNPYFVDEITRLLLSQGSLEVADPTSLGVPAGIASVIRRRLRALPESALDALRVAAVVGRDFELPLVARVANASAADVRAAFEAAIAAGLAREPSQAGALRFAHALVRETLHADLAPSERARLHGAVARELERTRAGDASALPAIAHHYAQAAIDPTFAEPAIACSVRAGRSALEALAAERAHELFEQAERLAAARAIDPRLRMEIQLGLGDALAVLGRLGRAQPHYREAARLAREVVDANGLARAALGLATEGENGIHANEERVALLEEALRALGSAESSLRTRVESQLAESLYFSDRHSESLPLAQRALAAARAGGDVRTLALALRVIRWVAWTPANVRERLAYCDEMIALGRAHGSLWAVEGGLFGRVDNLFEQGDGAALDAALAASEELRGERDLARVSWLLDIVSATRAAMRGRFDEAEERAQRALALGRSMDVERSNDWFGIQLVQQRELQGRSREILPAAREIAARRPFPVVLAGFSRVLLRCGEHEEVRRIVGELLASGSALRRDVNWPFVVQSAAEACARLRIEDCADALYRELLAFDGRHVVAGLNLAYVGPAAHTLGLLARVRGDLGAARRHLDDAVAQAERAGGVVAHALARRDRLELWLAESLAEPRIESERDALAATAERLGLPYIAAGLASQRAPARAPRAHAASSVAELAFEGDTWRLAFSGAEHRLRDVRGLHYLARLLASPGVEIHVLDLMGASAVPDETPLGALDARARREIRARLEELRSELDGAESRGERERAGRAREEIERISDSLARDLGLGGRERRTGTAAEKARVNVTRTLGLALRRIEEALPELGDRLRRSVRTGAFCAFEPSPHDRIEWRVELPRARSR